MKKPVIEFKNFNFKYNAQKYPTLKNINLTIYEGEKILIVGPSGSGKSTLGNCINGLIPFVYKGKIEGSLVVDGKEPIKSSLFDINKSIGTVLQDPDGQFVGLTVGEDIAFALENDCVPQEEMKERVLKIAEQVDMSHLLMNNPQELSGGQKQRVSLAGVMVTEANILLFDEPLANLDPKTGKVAIELIDDLNKKNNTVVIIEHRLEDVLHCPVDRIVVMSEGEVIMDDTPAKVLSSNVLIDHGIREPLYVTCCKYAGVNITEAMHPESIDTFDVEGCKTQIQQWYQENKNTYIPEDKPELLKLDHITFSYDDKRKVLDDVSLTIHEGEMMAIVGKNGAGKSTLARVMVGFEHQDEGTIMMEGIDLTTLSLAKRAEYVGIILQNPNQMISKAMIYDEIAFGLQLRGYPADVIDQKVDEVLKICGLEKFKKWPISALSFGQKKRVTIASILVLNPKILILDEPTAGQDYHHYSDIMEFLKQLNENGQTIIMITHDMHLMLEYTKRAVVLTDSKLLADERAHEVLFDKELIDKANLKETSLFDLAQKADIKDALGFVECFISVDERRRYEGE
ncbi:MAG: ABC transporter ATP-binding protein [Erysipelotrichaceae bacterium]|nr:ABC transporter ATP-binding protein [Erysipelotrichaceae bacterium]